MTSIDEGVPQDEHQGLEEQRRFLLDSLRDLEREREAGDISEDDYNSLRDEYTARAAAVLKALEPVEARSTLAGETGPEAAHPADSTDSSTIESDSVGEDRDDRTESDTDDADVDGEDGFPADDDFDEAAPEPRRRKRTVATIAVILIIALAAGIGVALFSGQQVSGPALLDGTPAEQLVRAHQRDSAGKAADAIKLYDSVLKAEPNNVEALTYRGWLLARAGLGDQALASLDKAIATNPAYPDAHFFRGVVIYRDRGDPGAAIPEFETFLADNPPPDAIPAVQSVLDQARQDLAAKNNPAPPTTAPGAPPPAG